MCRRWRCLMERRSRRGSMTIRRLKMPRTERCCSNDCMFGWFCCEQMLSKNFLIKIFVQFINFIKINKTEFRNIEGEIRLVNDSKMGYMKQLSINLSDKLQQFSGRMERCHRFGPSSILGYSIFYYLFLNFQNIFVIFCLYCLNLVICEGKNYRQIYTCLRQILSKILFSRPTSPSIQAQSHMSIQKQLQSLRKKCFSTLQVKKVTTRLNSRTPLQSKKHCPQDQACFHCCQCWLKFKDEYNKRVKYLETKIDDSQKQNALLKQCIERLARQNLQLKNKVKNTTDFQTIKENLRQELNKHIDDEIKMNDLIQKEKIAGLTEKVKEKELLIEKFQKQVARLQVLLKEETQKLQKAEAYCGQLRKDLQAQKLSKEQVQTKNNELTQEMKNLNSQIETLRMALKQKDLNLSGMKSTIDHTDRLISIKSSQLAEKDFQKTKVQLESSYKSQVLQKMQKVNQQHSKSISLLEVEKSKLNQLVGSLKEELISGDIHKNVLKMALDDAETLALEKSVSLENLKHDVRMLKYRVD